MVSATFSTLLLVGYAFAAPHSTNTRRAVDPALVPEFGIEAGQGDDGTGNCKGVDDALIPCSCPPDRGEFISKLNEFVDAGNSFGTAVSFPTGDDSDSKKTRINTAIITLQNLNGKGQGCPIKSTTFQQQLNEA